MFQTQSGGVPADNKIHISIDSEHTECTRREMDIYSFDFCRKTGLHFQTLGCRYGTRALTVMVTLAANTTGNREFAVCLNVCRVLFLGHTVNSTFAVRRELNTRRIESTRRIENSPCAPGPTHGESRLRCVPIRQPTVKWAPR